MNSQAIKMLYDEHDVILKATERAKTILKEENIDTYKAEIEKLVNFFGEYGRDYHHKKEEDVLFPLLTEKNEMLGLTLIEALMDHHENFKENLEEVVEALSVENWDTVKTCLKNYVSDLEDHISAENDELFVSAEMLLNDDESEKVYFEFQDLDIESGQERKNDLENHILEASY